MVRLAGVPALVVAMLVAARVMSPTAFGHLSTFIALSSVFSILTTSLERLLLREASDGDASRVVTAWSRRYMWKAGFVTVVLGAIAGVVAEALGGPLPPSAIPAAAVLGAVWGSVRSAQALHRTKGDFIRGQVPNELVRPVLLGLGFVVAGVLSQSRVSFEVGAAVFLTATFVVAVWVLPILRTPAVSIDPGTHARLRSSTAWFTSTSALSLLSDRSTEVLAGFLAPGAPAGAYALALRFTSMCAFGLSTGQFLYGPTMARLRTTNDRTAELAVVRRVRQLSNLFAFACAAPLLVVPGWILDVLAPDFAGYENALRVAAVAGVLAAWTGPSQLLLEMHGLERIVSYSYAVSLTLSVLFAPPLIDRYGATGAALAFALATGCREGYLMVTTYRRCGMWPGSPVVAAVLGLRRADAPADASGGAS